MRKLFFILFLFASFGLYAQQNEDLYNLSRQIIYGESPIGVITNVNDDSLRGLRNYAMKGTDPSAVKQLNDNDAWLLSMLFFRESNRRDSENTTEFLVYLQERAEWLRTQPMTGITGRAEGWVSAYDLLIRTRQLSVGR